MTKQILVVEDDDNIRDLITTALSVEGFEVEGVTNAAAGMAKLDDGQFDLVVADVRLPGGLDGHEMVKGARAQHPLLRCLYISGSGRPIRDDPIRDEFVYKPFRATELVGCVWELLARDCQPPLGGVGASDSTSC